MVQRDSGGDLRDVLLRIARMRDRLRAPSDQMQAALARHLAVVARVTAPLTELTGRLERLRATLVQPPSLARLRFEAPSRVWRAGEGWSTRPRSLVDALVDPSTPAVARRLIAEDLAALDKWWWDVAFPNQAVTEKVLARRVAALLWTADDAMASGRARIGRQWVKDAQGSCWVGRRIDLPSRSLFAEWFFQRLRGRFGGDVHHALPRTETRAVPSPLELLEASERAPAGRSLVALLSERKPELLQTLSAVERETLEHWEDRAADEAARLQVKVETVWQRRSRLGRRFQQARIGR